MTDPNKALDGIKDYLSSGGLFNPELMDHAAVRDLIINCRDTIDALKAALKPFADAKIPEHVLGQYIKISVMTIPFNGEHDISPYAFHAARRALEGNS